MSLFCVTPSSGQPSLGMARMVKIFFWESFLPGSVWEPKSSQRCAMTELDPADSQDPFFFWPCIWKFPGPGSNPRHSSNLSHCCDNAGSLTGCATRELPHELFIVENFKHLQKSKDHVMNFCVISSSVTIVNTVSILFLPSPLSSHCNLPGLL